MLACAVRVATAAGLADGLATDDPVALDAAVGAIERAPAATPDLADAMFAAAHACEDRLANPTRALALYERLAREHSDAGVAIAAGRRAEQLRAQIGSTSGAEANAFARLVAEADRLSPEEVTRRADALAAAAWPGAAGARVWLGNYLCRLRRFADADARLVTAPRDRARCAIDARDWERAEPLVAALGTDPARAELEAALATGRHRARMVIAAWLAFVLVLAALAASLAEACLRGGWRAPSLRPPVEIVFLAPIAAVIAAASYLAHQAIAPAVLRISLAGVVLAWLSGTTLDTLRARGRSTRVRSLAHVVACALGVLAIGYIAVMRDDLLELLTG